MQNDEDDLMKRAIRIYERGHYFLGDQPSSREAIIAEIYKGLCEVHLRLAEPIEWGTMTAMTDVVFSELQPKEDWPLDQFAFELLWIADHAPDLFEDIAAHPSRRVAAALQMLVTHGYLGVHMPSQFDS